jgi:molecular chaperone GrpE
MSGSRQEETDPAEVSTAAEGEEASAAGLVDSPLEEALGRIAELEARLRQVSAAYREKQEEAAQVRDRLGRQAQLQEEIRRGEVVMALFEPVENLLRSLDAVKGHAAEAGLRMVYGQFMEALKKLGLEEVPGVGTRFDPNLHEAIATAPVSETKLDNVVVSVFSSGYRIGARLVRPARVVIGSYTAPVAEA